MTNQTELERLDAKYRLLAADILPANEKRCFDFIAHAGKSQVGAEAFSIFIYDPASDKVWLKAGTGREEHDIEVPREGSFVGKTISTKQNLTVKDADKVDGAHKIIDAATGFTTRNVACVPIHGLFRDEAIGVVQALNKVGGDGFSDEDVRFLEEAAYMLQLHADHAFLTQNVCVAAENAESRRRKAVNMAIAAALIPVVLLSILLFMMFASTLGG